MTLTGTPSKFSTQVEHLAAGLPDLLKRRTQTKHVRQRQAQRRLTPEQMAQLAAEYEAGDSMKALAARWQLHRTTVAEHLRRAGVKLRRLGIPPERVVEVAQLYVEGWSCQRLAERYGCDDETVRQALKRTASGSVGTIPVIPKTRRYPISQKFVCGRSPGRLTHLRRESILRSVAALVIASPTPGQRGRAQPSQRAHREHPA